MDDLKQTNVKEGDLVMLVSDGENRLPIRIAIFERFPEREEYGFYAERVLYLGSPDYFGEVKIPNTNNRMVYHEQTSCIADRIYVGKKQVIEGLKKEPTMAPYAAFIEESLKKS